MFYEPQTKTRAPASECLHSSRYGATVAGRALKESVMNLNLDVVKDRKLVKGFRKLSNVTGAVGEEDNYRGWGSQAR